MTIIWCMVPEIWSIMDWIFLSFWTIFCPFTPLTTRKIKILKKWKKTLEILLFYTCVPQITIILCIIPEISSTTDRTFCHFGPFFSQNSPKQHEKSKLKKWKKAWRYHHFTQVSQKSWSYAILFLRYSVWQI